MLSTISLFIKMIKWARFSEKILEWLLVCFMLFVVRHRPLCVLHVLDLLKSTAHIACILRLSALFVCLLLPMNYIAQLVQ